MGDEQRNKDIVRTVEQLWIDEKLDQLDQFRNRGIGSSKETGNWMHAFSEVLTAPPAVEILHVDGAEAK